MGAPRLDDGRTKDEGLQENESDWGNEHPKSQLRRASFGLCRSLVCAAVPLLLASSVAAWKIYKDAVAARPWYDIHQGGFHFNGEGPTAFRVSLSGSTVGAVNPHYSNLRVKSVRCDVHLEVLQPDGAAETMPLAQLEAIPPPGDDVLLRFGDVEPDVIQQVDVRAVDINLVAARRLIDVRLHKHMQLTMEFGYTTVLSFGMGISTPGLSLASWTSSLRMLEQRMRF
eukprot:COSAG02_NODE_10086_length_2029_cov_3.344560_2_plen_227_part_00